MIMSPSQTVALVAQREIVTMLRSKAFRILTGAILLIIVALVVVFKIVAATGGPGGGATVGITRSETALAAPLRSGAAANGQQVSTTTVPDEQAGRAKVADGSLDALLVETGGDLHVVVQQELDPSLHHALNVLAGKIALNQQIRSLGGDPAAVNAAVADADVTVEPLTPPQHYNVAQIVLGSVTGVLIYMSLLIQGQRVAQGVVEEKSSRVVELLLATVQPWQLMAGKVAGIGIVGLLQMLLFGVVGVALATGLGVLTLSISAAAGTVIWLIVWYLLGFFMYAFLFAAAGALVSRQEDAAGVVMPVLVPVIASYVLGISVLPSDPGNPLCEVLSVIPIFSPTLMPMRLAMGGVALWETVVSVVLVAGMIPLFAWLSGRIYRNAVLRTGARVKLSTALRPA